MEIRSIKIVREVDDHPDLSWIGEYTSQPGRTECTVDRAKRGEQGRGEYRYFVAALSPDETGNPNSVEEDYQRMESYGQNWCSMGVYARAEVVVNGTIQRIRSGGLWGIESDSEESYFTEIGEEQLAELSEILQAMGANAEQIEAVEIENEDC